MSNAGTEESVCSRILTSVVARHDMELVVAMTWSLYCFHPNDHVWMLWVDFFG